MDRYKIYNDFIEDVLKDNKDFEDFESLRNRFYNLTKMNKKLIQRQVEIYNYIEEEKRSEKDTLAKLQTELVIHQRILRQSQKDLEIISNQNSKMEQEFENQIKKKNKQNQEHGQFIRAINNVYDICIEQFHERGKYRKYESKEVYEHSKNLNDKLVEKLEMVKEVVADSEEIEKISSEFTRDRYYELIAQGAAKDQKGTQNYQPIKVKNPSNV